MEFERSSCKRQIFVDLRSLADVVAAGVQSIIVGDASREKLAAAVDSSTSGLLTLSRDLADLVRRRLDAISQENADDFALDQAGSGDFLEPSPCESGKC